jgi:hypothetical protein
MKKNKNENTFILWKSILENMLEKTEIQFFKFELTCGRTSNLAIASGYDMKANPVPPLTT